MRQVNRIGKDGTSQHKENGNKCFYALGKLLKSKVLSKEVKTQL